MYIPVLSILFGLDSVPPGYAVLTARQAENYRDENIYVVLNPNTYLMGGSPCQATHIDVVQSWVNLFVTFWYLMYVA
jgi:hypothetical protein